MYVVDFHELRTHTYYSIYKEILVRQGSENHPDWEFYNRLHDMWPARQRKERVALFVNTSSNFFWYKMVWCERSRQGIALGEDWFVKHVLKHTVIALYYSKKLPDHSIGLEVTLLPHISKIGVWTPPYHTTLCVGKMYTVPGPVG